MQHLKIRIYTTPNCPYCRKAKEYFRKLGLKFKEIDVSKNPAEAEKLFKKTKQMGVPVIEIGNLIIIGFDRAKIDRAIGLD